MSDLTKVILTLTGSFLVFGFGVFRIVTELLASTPLVVAWIFAVTGLIGVIANGIMLRKLKTN
ncbi:hypothetical protein [Salipaludibacillus aurantiacus]|uniref:Uncharacterized protein n=1 Tax=Salipaludibacillus aurantiacus TaxID=1601833 RepID=A0A1H9Q9I9_9BACI|nr:hypothetical protein [Salipaludibacillus aurantiacus]SER56513.1 hypothetical protein SAMN05518684_10277 [Salipaludibacillus aurantiacus]